jgi:SAM-dependent methyltransferase
MDHKVLGHLQVLREKVFQVDELWPQYRLLLDDICELSDQSRPGSVVVSIERTLLYGGLSLIAPLFQHTAFTSIDCSPISADQRGAYNQHLVDDSRFIPIPADSRASIYETGLPDGEADLVLVPNLVHHIADQGCLFSELSRIVKPGGKVYVFEALVREIHQAPDDFLRYTPFGLERALSQAGLELESPPRTEGGPFQVITYCWTQALQHLPDEIKKPYSEWFFAKHFPELMELDRLYPHNLEKQFSSFPMSFSMKAVKPFPKSL